MRIQLEIQHEDKETKVAAVEMLEVPPVWNEVPDLMMEDEDSMMITEADTKPKRDEVARGRRKRQKEDYNNYPAETCC